MIADGWLERLGLRTPWRPQQRSVRSGAGAGAARRRSVPRRLPRPGPRALLILAAILAALAGAWLWVRDSSLVAVRHVAVTGVSGPDARRIRSALMIAARNMTTLDVNRGELNTAVEPYPVVKSLQVSTQFPHGMRIRVIEQIPVGQITLGGRAIAVASDGTLLHDSAPVTRLPTIAMPSLPGGAQVTDPKGREIIAMLAAAPFQLLSHVSQASYTQAHGLVAQLRNGPIIYFGDASRLDAKWSAATAVLADGGAAGAAYVDVTDPQRPVAGQSAATGASANSSASAATGATATSTTTAATGASAASSTSTATPAGGSATAPPGG